MWRQIVADVLNIPIHIPETEQGPAYGAALLAMRGCGAVVLSGPAACRWKETLLPRRDWAEKYEKDYCRFKMLYPAIKQARI